MFGMATDDRPENLESLLAVYLLDLRSQYESQLRELTAAQRALEELRAADGPEKRVQSHAVLSQRIQLLRATNQTVAEGLTEAEREIALIDPAKGENAGPSSK
jgi:hypothetical protein